MLHTLVSPIIEAIRVSRGDSSGTNFIGTKPVLEELYEFLNGLDRSGLEEVAAQNGTDWQWKIQPADSPHRNGATEAAVRIVKKALQSLGRGLGLSYSEFQTTLQLAANLANERPMDARVQSCEDSVQYITPNAFFWDGHLQVVTSKHLI
ncbi:hypothetical protein QQF64_012189 [Cirrhinus molitorella]|uniref:Integrase catalytic domain-containing protein n=1 Tax=Cirrhinus molitorella TaxID=172907 RepID=A0ABR3LXZ0_9TELE